MRAMSESEFAKCECCGLVEECTAHYIERIRGGFCDRFICGLCAGAVKEEQCRSRLRSAGAHHRHPWRMHCPLTWQSVCNSTAKFVTIRLCILPPLLPCASSSPNAVAAAHLKAPPEHEPPFVSYLRISQFFSAKNSTMQLKKNKNSRHY
ncbi:hypothetical protein O6H91_02G082800 [Diphasiastrum complanatum]|uniref:Uncharacterized protein n=1 Tax=Diphasiastrum complanatum TaxID=34168 RepID=A0ACC2EHN1_DIPCM|nr:hypothetical protein O6H91_02G082800 [Diphasiastrum complanatum]